MAILAYADFEGRDALVAQARTARVDGHCACGCATVSLDVDRTRPSAPEVRSPIPNSADVFDANGERIGGIIVFVHDGYLSSLEIYWFGDEPISPFPPLDRLSLQP